jgi:hypothetical protein
MVVPGTFPVNLKKLLPFISLLLKAFLIGFIRQSHSCPFGQKLHGFHKFHPFHAHYKGNNIASFTASETMIYLSLRRHMEGGSLFIMKGTESEVSSPDGL